MHSSIGAEPPVLFLTVKRFCHERSLPPSTFYKQVKAGQIVPVKRGRRTLIRLAEAERYDNSLPIAVGGAR